MKYVGKNLGLVMLSLAVIAVSGTTYGLAQEQVQEPTVNESGFVKGHVEVVVTDEEGNIKAYRQSDNAIVENGMDLLAKRLFSGITGTTSTDASLTHMGIGTGGETGAASTQTALVTPITDCARVAASFSTTGKTSAGGFATIPVSATATFDASADNDCATSSIDEAGLFNALTSGNMFSRNTFSAVTLSTSDSLAVTWTFTFSDT